MRVRDVKLYLESVESTQSIMDGDRRMSICCSIDYHTLSGVYRLLQAVNDGAFVIGLKENDIQSVLAADRSASVFDILQCAGAVNLRLPRAQQIKIWPVYDVNCLCH
jgi:hypothetical protein